MPFTNEEKTRLFDKLEDHSVALGKIETKLDSSEKKFDELKETRDWANRHEEHHKTLKWVLGGIGFVIMAVGTWMAL
jgi:hypothetical protein